MSMNVNELMIGDWVSVAGTEMKVACIGTDRIGFEDSKGEIFFHDADNVKAIELYTLLLEGNGFVFVENETPAWELEFKSYYGVKNVEIDYSGHGSKLFAYDEDKSESIELSIRYVHQLQHAIRLLGIDKEIIL